MAGTKPGHDAKARRFPDSLLRQIAFAAKPQVFRRFHLRHLQQMAEHLEPVTPRQARELDEVLRDQGHGLVRPAIP
jgi:hypothetical protein